jgi:hypothetical protein
MEPGRTDCMKMIILHDLKKNYSLDFSYAIPNIIVKQTVGASPWMVMRDDPHELHTYGRKTLCVPIVTQSTTDPKWELALKWVARIGFSVCTSGSKAVLAALGRSLR